MSIRKSSLRPPNRAWKTWSSQTGQTDRYGICSVSTLHLFGPGSQLTISNSNARNIRVFRLKKTVICKVSNKIQAEKVRFYKHATTKTLRIWDATEHCRLDSRIRWMQSWWVVQWNRLWAYCIPEILTRLTCFGVLLSTRRLTAIDSPW